MTLVKKIKKRLVTTSTTDDWALQIDSITSV